MNILNNLFQGNDILRLVLESTFFIKLVLLLLVFFSIACWAIVIMKYRLLRKAKRESAKFLDIFWNTRKLDVIYESSKQLSYSPLAEVFKAGYIELVNLKSAKTRKKEESFEHDFSEIENIKRSLNRAAIKETTHLEKYVSFLATTASSAPFIGLFGTVWGIMSSFIDIGATKDTSLAVVAPGLSEALIATAVGLMAAIPAAIFYNVFVAKIRVLSNEMDNFSSDFLNILERHIF